MQTDLLRPATCPACGFHVAVPFFDGGDQPLATIAWPESEKEARAMERLPLSFVRCIECGHIYNDKFDYSHVPYSEKPNLMYNRAPVWIEHLHQVRDLILEHLPESPTVVEIGCGEGHLLRELAEARPSGRYIGFDPNGSVNTKESNVEARKELFYPEIHMEECKPDIIIGRHVLEHLMNSLGFLQQLDSAANIMGVRSYMFLEVPCIDGVLETGRIADFYYEHNSHFTTASFTRMLERCTSGIELIRHGYSDEVIYGLAKLGGSKERAMVAEEAYTFSQNARQAKSNISAQLDVLHGSGRTVAIWGGTGKGAAFMNYYGVDRSRFPLVVDSDPDKVGTFVPGAGQEIRYRDALLDNPVDVLIIPTQWRARDIVREMDKCGICPESVLIEHNRELVEYHSTDHPYK